MAHHDGLPPIHPGLHLADDLAAMDMSAAALARRLKVPPNRISAVVTGKRSISADTALRLGRYFGMAPEFWLSLQQRHDLKVAQAKRGDEIARIAIRDLGAQTAVA